MINYHYTHTHTLAIRETDDFAHDTRRRARGEVVLVAKHNPHGSVHTRTQSLRTNLTWKFSEQMCYWCIFASICNTVQTNITVIMCWPSAADRLRNARCGRAFDFRVIIIIIVYTIYTYIYDLGIRIPRLHNNSARVEGGREGWHDRISSAAARIARVSHTLKLGRMADRWSTFIVLLSTASKRTFGVLSPTHSKRTR